MQLIDFFYVVVYRKTHQAILLIIRHASSWIFLEEQYLLDHLGDCMVLKRTIFVLL